MSVKGALFRCRADARSTAINISANGEDAWPPHTVMFVQIGPK